MIATLTRISNNNNSIIIQKTFLSGDTLRAKQKRSEECDDLWPQLFANLVVCHFIHNLNMSEFLLIKSAALDFSIQWICWAIAACRRTEKFYDLAGSLTFILLSLLSLKWGDSFYHRQKIQTAFICIWALRLGSYLFFRIMSEGYDHRFDRVRDHPLKFLLYWTIQGVWVFVTLLPTLILNFKKEDQPLSVTDYFGWTLWTVGFLLETVADWQKFRFRSDTINKGRFIRTGLWSISRHPNYFGEILLWFGLFISASSVMNGKEYLSVLSPVCVAFLIIRVSGIPLLENSAFKRWGTSPAYAEYVQSTAVLIPFIW